MRKKVMKKSFKGNCSLLYWFLLPSSGKMTKSHNHTKRVTAATCLSVLANNMQRQDLHDYNYRIHIIILTQWLNSKKIIMLDKIINSIIHAIIKAWLLFRSAWTTLSWKWTAFLIKCQGELKYIHCFSSNIFQVFSKNMCKKYINSININIH